MSEKPVSYTHLDVYKRQVKDGYARNYLLPRGFAVTWTQGGEKQVESIRAARAARAKASLEEAQAIAASLACLLYTSSMYSMEA